MSCQDCGNETNSDHAVCAGAIGYEVGSSPHPVIDFQGLRTCNCCDSCRDKCFQSMQEEYPDL